MKTQSVLEHGNKARGAGIFVENETKSDSSSVGAAPSAKPTEYAAPTGLNSGYVVGLQRCRTYGAGAGRVILIALGFIILHSAFCLSAFGQSYAIDWYKVAGGGGTSTNGQYSVSGTIGQPDASGAMSGGNYSVTGGFWSLIKVVQTVGLPNLIIVPNGPNSVQILWADTGSYTLQQNANLAVTGGWATSGYPITLANGTNSITISPPTGNLFFRLKQ
jgi:hypothetical protein